MIGVRARCHKIGQPGENWLCVEWWTAEGVRKRARVGRAVLEDVRAVVDRSDTRSGHGIYAWLEGTVAEYDREGGELSTLPTVALDGERFVLSTGEEYTGGPRVIVTEREVYADGSV